MKNVSTAIWTRLADIAGLVATPLVPSHYIGRLLDSVRIKVENHEISPFAREALRTRGSDAVTRTSHEGDLILQVHVRDSGHSMKGSPAVNGE